MEKVKLNKQCIELGQSGLVAYKVENESQGSNLTLFIFDSKKGSQGVFRFHYSDEARKNARYPEYRIHEVYFENVSVEGNFSTSYRVDNMTDLFLFIERKKNWILEYFMQEYEKVIENAARISN